MWKRQCAYYSWGSLNLQAGRDASLRWASSCWVWGEAASEKSYCHGTHASASLRLPTRWGEGLVAALLTPWEWVSPSWVQVHKSPTPDNWPREWQPEEPEARIVLQGKWLWKEPDSTTIAEWDPLPDPGPKRNWAGNNCQLLISLELNLQEKGYLFFWTLIPPWEFNNAEAFHIVQIRAF